MQTRRPLVAAAACAPSDHVERSRPEPDVSDVAYERAATFFRAAGDVPRLKILSRLAVGEWCVTELAQTARVSLPTVSQQLRLLRAAGLVNRRRSAKHVYYSLADGHIRDLLRNALEHAAEEPPSRDED
jgi:DNA-binding transcriptional ArsR family regulator